MWPLLLLTLSAFAQDDADLKAVRDFSDQLPEYNMDRTDDENDVRPEVRKHLPLIRKVPIDLILRSGKETVFIAKGKSLLRLKDQEKIKLREGMTVKALRLPDEHGFKYLVSEDNRVVYRTHVDNITPIKQELVLYEPPRRFTPAQPVIFHEYDRKLTLVPEASFYVGFSQGDYMRDLFQDAKGNGFGQQYGAHVWTEWDLPVKIGGVLHYESTMYNLTSNGKINYTSFSFGPQFKTHDFEFLSVPLRSSAQFRIGPFSRAELEGSLGNADFRFNSTDLLLSLEHPVKNSFGSFVLGLFFQNQWLSIRDQPENVSIKASNETNKSYGLSFSQVFQ